MASHQGQALLGKHGVEATHRLEIRADDPLSIRHGSWQRRQMDFDVDVVDGSVPHEQDRVGHRRHQADGCPRHRRDADAVHRAGLSGCEVTTGAWEVLVLRKGQWLLCWVFASSIARRAKARASASSPHCRAAGDTLVQAISLIAAGSLGVSAGSGAASAAPPFRTASAAPPFRTAIARRSDATCLCCARLELKAAPNGCGGQQGFQQDENQLIWRSYC
jgi:hypothetical protein